MLFNLKILLKCSPVNSLTVRTSELFAANHNLSLHQPIWGLVVNGQYRLSTAHWNQLGGSAIRPKLTCWNTKNETHFYVDFTQRLLDGFWIPTAQTKVLGGIYSFLVFLACPALLGKLSAARSTRNGRLLGRSATRSVCNVASERRHWRHAIDSFFRTTDVL